MSITFLWRDDYGQCGQNTLLSPARLSLALLRVCRQVHSEAALLPFTTNTFVFEYVEDLSTITTSAITGKLIPEQRQAITNIALVHSNLRDLGFGRITLASLDKLSGLRNLTILANVSYDLKIKRGIPRPAVDIAAALEKTTQSLKYIKWQTATVCVTASMERAGPRRIPYSRDGIQQISRAAEQTLLEAWDGDEQRAAEKVEKRKELERRKRERQEFKKIDREDRAEMRRWNWQAWKAQQKEKAEQLEAKRLAKEKKSLAAAAKKDKDKATRKAESTEAGAKLEGRSEVRVQWGLRKVKAVSYVE